MRYILSALPTSFLVSSVDMADRKSLLKFQKSGFKMKVSNKDANDSKINFFYISINWAPMKNWAVQKNEEK